MSLLNVCLLFSFVVLVSSGVGDPPPKPTSKATKLCSPGQGDALSGGLKGSIYIHVESTVEIVSIYVPGSECCNFKKEDRTDGKQVYSAEVNTTDESVVECCKVEHISNTKAKMTFRVSFERGPIITIDSIPDDSWLVECDWTVPNTITVSTSIQVKLGAKGKPLQEQGKLRFEMLSTDSTDSKDNDLKPRSKVGNRQIRIGHKCSIWLTLYDRKFRLDHSLRIYDCIATDDNGAASLNITLIGSNGCGIHEHAKFNKDYGYTRTVSDDEIVYMFKTFKCFKFRKGKNSLKVTCTISRCFKVEDERCKIPTCALPKSRRDVSRYNNEVHDSEIITDDDLYWEEAVPDNNDDSKLETIFSQVTGFSILVALVLFLTVIIVIDQYKSCREK